MTTREAACGCGTPHSGKWRAMPFRGSLGAIASPPETADRKCLRMQAAFTPDQVNVVGRFSDYLRISQADSKEHVFQLCPDCGSQVFYTEPDEANLIVVVGRLVRRPLLPAADRVGVRLTTGLVAPRCPPRWSTAKRSVTMSGVIDHVGIRVGDLAASRRMYEAALAGIGFVVLSEGESRVTPMSCSAAATAMTSACTRSAASPAATGSPPGAHRFCASDAGSVRRWHEARWAMAGQTSDRLVSVPSTAATTTPRSSSILTATTWRPSFMRPNAVSD